MLLFIFYTFINTYIIVLSENVLKNYLEGLILKADNMS